jgi:hypothetical protein
MLAELGIILTKDLKKESMTLGTIKSDEDIHNTY